ncbi:helix-turn-helix transcriptional regulator [uncultured Merdimonas sp.]|uniref:helix-turn-helix transcriptional regulator n=1 Tax=uncultured Merdimonas sp. TaxID=2023269 RepID=UPI003208535D
MSLGKVIRKYRKIRNMTQEKMAERLGVTAPAVNKWENENSYPDILLLAPIARLLGISLDTLLSFREELTMEEITGILYEAEKKLKEESFEDAFQWAKKTLEEYPNCELLILNLAILFDAQCIMQEIPEEAGYEDYFCSLYTRIVDSADEAVRVSAADALVNLYIRKKKYDMAEKYLEYFSIQNPRRKQKQAQIYAETGRIKEAYKAYEELLFSDYQRSSMELQGMYLLAVQDADQERARMLVDKQKEIAKCFEMGKYYEIFGELTIATMEKDADKVIAAAEEMLSSMEEIGSFRYSPLYEHMEFKEVNKEFTTEMRENLLRCFREEERYSFLQDDERWKKLVQRSTDN